MPPLASILMTSSLRSLLDVDPTRLARGVLADRVGRLLDLAAAPTLDLSPVQHLAGEAVTWAPSRSLEPIDRRFMTVVSVLRTTIERNIDDYARRLAALVDPDEGRLLFAEPTRGGGLAGGLQRLWRPATEVSTNVRLHTGFRLALWHAGLSVIEVDRLEMPRRAWPITSVAVGVARHTPVRRAPTRPSR
jgi:hypothetical protein